MIKPILYNDIGEKNKIEAELISDISEVNRLTVSQALMDLFLKIGLKVSNRKQRDIQTTIND